ncbi:chromosome segregation protein SMC [Gemella cuniculi]|uniref:chromosome segregation protein SMC n=1 Tax=Gemella cuniculi TaxID=150240 RepID=UPI00040F2201|nr:chromosome segregation protein SMC [Gemella cuniculi]
MKLSKVEVTGFKSFQKKTTFEFKNNLIGVVGPNGSGKSNIIDAIRWVLGEQSAKNLRGSSMKDVIFSGTEDAKKKNFAEVAVTFTSGEENCEVKRRLYRNGDSEYFIDNKRAKLKDITNLYLDFGINKESYSIITQGKVEDIISSKPVDRRAIIEEASGVLKYKNKKKETNAKLEKTNDNLTRLNDIFSEISARYEALEEQKNKTLKYLDYTKELEEKDILISVYNISEYQKNLEVLLAEKKIKQQEKENLELKQEGLIKELEIIKNNLIALDRTYLKYHDEELELVQKKEGLQSELNVIEERKNNRTLRSEKLQEDTEYQLIRKNNLLEKIKEREKSFREQKEKIQNIIKEINLLEKDESYNLEIIEENIEDLKDKYYNLINEETKLENSIEFARKNFKNADNNYKQLLESIEKQKNLFNNRKSDLGKLDKEKKDLITYLSTSEEKISKLLEKNITLISQEKNIEEQLRTGYNFQNNLENRKKFLDDQINNLSFYNVGVKEILANKQTLVGVHNSVANIISFSNEYAVSLDIALGQAQQNIIVENEKVAKNCIEHLKKTNKGRVTFLPLNNIKPRVIASDIYNILMKEKGFINIAENLVKVDDAYRNIVSHLLGLIIVVDNVDNANRIAKNINFRNRIITLDGQVINSGGSITGGAINKNNNSSIKHKAELDELIINLEKVNDKINTLLDEQEKINYQNKEIVEQVEDEKLSKENLSLRIKELELEETHQNTELENLKLNISQNEKRLEEYQNVDNNFEDIDKLVNNLEKVRAELSDLDKQIKEESNKKQTAQSKEEIFLEKIADLKIEKSKLEEIIKHTEETISNLETDLNDVNIQLEKLQTSKNMEELSGEDEKQILTNNIKLIAEHSKRLQTLKTLLSDLDFEKTGLFKKEKEITKEQQSNNENLRQKISDFEKLAISQTKVEVKIDEYLENLITDYSVTYESVEHKLTEEERKNISRYKTEVVALRKQILDLGNVNLNAVEEFLETEERYNFYNEQITDLIEAKVKLEQTISEIDKEVKERFLETFVQVAENFNQIFKQLFKGGYADMTLESPNDILNTGIIIEASPPGKKLQNLTLLSGGEKSLTAISLLFAILKVKKPPFVVLDEVEAALDEENVNRFSKFLRVYSKDNQFLVITHRRGTMEAMDTLYGITMQEKGISYVLELELKDIIENFDNIN